MAADHSARGSMKTGVKPETVCELQDTNDHRQVERKWRLPISVGKLSALEGRLINLQLYILQPWTFRHIGQCARAHVVPRAVRCTHGVVSSANSGFVTHTQTFGVHALGLYGNAPYRMCIERYVILFDLGGAGLRTELKHIIKCRKRNQMGFP